MAAAARARPEDYFNAEEWRSLSERSTWRGLWLVAHCWGVIAIAMLMGAIWPLTIPFAVMVIGTRQLGLFVLMHDAAHATLHVNRRVNDWVGTWFCSAGLRQYRPYHLQHHRFEQQSEDPDLVLSAPFPISRASLARKVMRDLSGQTFYKQHFGHIAPAIRARASGESALQRLRLELAKDKRFLLSHALGFAVFAAAGGWWIWLTLWLLPIVCWLPLAVRIRNIAEHALVGKNQADPLRQARTTQANWLERTLIAPYWVNYHCEHHLAPTMPYHALPKLNRLVRDHIPLAPSYPAAHREIWRHVSRPG